MQLCEKVASGDQPTLVLGKRYAVEFQSLTTSGERRRLHFYFMRSDNFADRFVVAFISVTHDDESSSNEEWNQLDNIMAGDSFVIDSLYENYAKIGAVLLELNKQPSTFSVRRVEYEDFDL